MILSIQPRAGFAGMVTQKFTRAGQDFFLQLKQFNFVITSLFSLRKPGVSALVPQGCGLDVDTAGRTASTLCWEGLGFLEDTDLSQHLKQPALLINTLPGLHNKSLKPVLTHNKIKVSVKVII